jgi:ATP-dependent DNA ligase
MSFGRMPKLGFEGIVSKRLTSPYRSGRVEHWLKIKNPAAPAVKREDGRQRRNVFCGLSFASYQRLDSCSINWGAFK